MNDSKGKYIFLEDVAIADIAYEAYGKNYNELFQNAAEAIFNITVDIKTLKPKIKKDIKLENEKIDDMLYDFLSEIVFLKDAEALIFCRCKVNINEKSKKFHLTSKFEGDKINPKTQKLDNDIKAITMHMFKLEKTKEGYMATIVVDI